MRQSRMKIPGESSEGYYHCVSRVIDRKPVFDAEARTAFAGILREYEDFCGVQVLTYCVMSDHFHILVYIPPRPDVLPGREEILRRINRLSCHNPGYASFLLKLDSLKGSRHQAERNRMLQSFFSRMWDVSWFIRLVKQRFTSWYNRRSDRKGGLWEERFRSVIVEGSPAPLLTMAAYIDLNPVRAGLVRDAADYQWSGLGEAVAGSRAARSGILALMSVVEGGGGRIPATRALQRYRELGHLGPEQGGRSSKKSLSADEVKALLKEKGRIPLRDYLRFRVRYFTDGAIFGSREFVDQMFQRMRHRFGPRRLTGARRLAGLQEPLFSLRQLQVDVFGRRRKSSGVELE